MRHLFVAYLYFPLLNLTTLVLGNEWAQELQVQMLVVHSDSGGQQLQTVPRSVTAMVDFLSGASKVLVVLAEDT